MALLYHYLFDDPKYAAEGALTFNLQPLFWGAGGQQFTYDERTLSEHLYWTMAQKGYLGIACEPNCVFQICNQVPILGFRLYDLIYGGSRAAEVTAGYQRAWSEFGILDGNGHYNIVVQERERALVRREPMAWSDFWLGALMHAWNPDFVKTNYPQQIARWAQAGPDDTLWIAPTIAPKGLQRELYGAQDFGWAAVCAAEVGDTGTRDRLLAYADRFLNPAWDDGAYFYRRRDSWYDQDGRLNAMDPHTGNALLAYARLNVPDGLRALYDGRWERSHFGEPTLAEMPPDLDVRGARYDAQTKTLALTFDDPRGTIGRARLGIAHVWGRGAWRLTVDGNVAARGSGAGVENAGTLPVRRDGELLVVECPLSARTAVNLSWE
jgi:hypothetical protein